VTGIRLTRLPDPRERQLAVSRSRALNRLTIGWNVAEGVIALVRNPPVKSSSRW
jgi:hypothetical protein